MEKKSLNEFLKNYDASIYEKPSVTVDNLLFAIDEIESTDIRKLNEKRLQILLVKRSEHPYIDMWNLPGTFLKLDETLEETSMRGLKVKAKLNNIYLEQLYTFADLKRDPRTRVLSVAYMGLSNKKSITVTETQYLTSWFTIKLNKLGNNRYEMILENDDEDFEIKSQLEIENDEIKIIENNDLAFDHAKIIYYGLMRLRNKLEYTDLAFRMLEEEFTYAELQQVYEVILDKKFTKANFQRKIKDRVVSSGNYRTGGFRPALLYKYKKNNLEN